MLCSGLSPAQNRILSWTNAVGKTRVRVFLLLHYFSITQKEKLTGRKTGTPVFSTAFFQPACDSCGGDKPEQSTQAQEKCDSWEFAEIRGWNLSLVSISKLTYLE